MTVNALLSFESIVKSVGGILLAIGILLAMITIHEFGHYIFGKLLNFKINEFSIGFGPALYKKRSKKTGELFAVRLIPLGGYCAFDGEDEGEPTPEEQKEQASEPFEGFEQKQRAEESEKVAVEEEYPEPQGIRFNDQAPWKRIIVLIAGATMNYLLALTLIILMFACIGQPLYKIQEPREGRTMNAAFEVGDVIESIDGEKVYQITDYMDAID